MSGRAAATTGRTSTDTNVDSQATHHLCSYDACFTTYGMPEFQDMIAIYFAYKSYKSTLQHMTSCCLSLLHFQTHTLRMYPYNHTMDTCIDWMHACTNIWTHACVVHAYLRAHAHACHSIATPTLLLP